MKVAVTGASGLIGRRLLAALDQRGDEVTVLTRSASRAGPRGAAHVLEWDPIGGPAPGLSGIDAVVHLAGEPVAQRWTNAVKEQIRLSREVGSANLVRGLEAADPRPSVLVSTSASGYYGDRGEEPLTETAASGPSGDFLASVCVAWEQAAERAGTLGLRVVIIRNGVVLDASGGALARMLPPFKLGVGGPIAGGRQFMPWIALDDVVGLYVAALDQPSWSGPINAAAPTPTRNAEFSHALGRALHRPAIAPVPSLALKVLFGEMAEMLVGSQHVVPEKAGSLGYEFRYPELDGALRAALG